MLKSISTFHYDEINNDVSKSKILSFTIKHLTKEKSLGSITKQNLIRRGESIRAEISLIGESYPESNER